MIKKIIHQSTYVCDPTALHDNCAENSDCKGYKEHCDHMLWEDFCSTHAFTSINYQCSANETFAIGIKFFGEKSKTKLCDGFHDCITSKADESNCTNRFYCLNGMDSIHISQVCDSSPDCADSSDECQDCHTDGLSTDKRLISSSFLRWFTVFQCVLILGLNSKAGYDHIQTKKETKVGRIDRILLISLALYDLIMGLYLLVIVIISFYHADRYCIHDLEWRSSATCSIIGTLFSISTHGSLLTGMLMSVTRCWTCVRPFSDQSYSNSVITLCVVQSISFILCVIPAIPLDFIQDFVETIVFFQNNPIVSIANDSTLREILSVYNNKEVNLKRSAVIASLSNMTTDGTIFKVSHSLGYHSESSLCININTINNQLREWKILYITLIGVVIGIIALSYILINTTAKKNQVEAPNNINNDQNTESKEKLKFLSVKVTIIILSQVACWVPILTAVILSFFHIEINTLFYMK